MRSGLVRAPGAVAGNGESSRRSYENRGASALSAGKIVMLNPAGTGMVAWDGAREPLGLLAEDTAPTFSGAVQLDGLLQLADWTAASGAQQLPSGTWWADPAAPGAITQVAPTAGVLQRVGLTVAPDIIDIRIAPPIRF